MALYLLLSGTLCFIPGTYAITDTEVGVIVAGAISGLILIALAVGIPLFVYLWRKRREPKQTKRNYPKHSVNGHQGMPNGYQKQNGFPKPHPYMPPRPRQRHPQPHPNGTFRGVPVVNMSPNASRRGTPHASRTTTPLGSVRGGPPRIVITPGGRGRPMMFPMGSIGPRGPFPMPGPRVHHAHPPWMPQGPYPYPDPMMYPYFFPPFPMYDDESEDDSGSDDDRRSNHSTMKERKMRYRRSFLPDRQSKLVIKEIDTDEEKIIRDEEKNRRNRRHSGSRSRSRTPEKRRSPSPIRRRSPSPVRRRSPSPERYRASLQHDLYTEVGKSSKRASSIGSTGDASARIDELFSFSDAHAKPGDVIFVPQGKHVDTPSRRREPSPPPRRDPSPPPLRNRSPSPIRAPSPLPRRPSTPPVPERRPINIETSDYHYASVIRPSEPPVQEPPTDLGTSLSERLQNIVESGHTEVEHELEKHRTEDVQYPPRTNNLSKSSRSYSEGNVDYPVPAKRLSATAKPDLSGDNWYTPVERRRPTTPPNDIPSEPPVPTPRQSISRRPPTPPNDIPESARSARPPTPPFDGDDVRKTSTPTVNRKIPPSMDSKSPSNLGSTQQAKSAFSNLVLEELKGRYRMPESTVDNDDDDNDSAKNRAVNFSASPPEIIPRSEPNSPRTSQNLSPDYPGNDLGQGAIPVAPPPPPPPPPPPLPK